MARSAGGEKKGELDSNTIRFLASLNTAFADPEPSHRDSYYGCFANKIAAVLRERVSTGLRPTEDAPIPVIFQVKPSYFVESEKDWRSEGGCGVKVLPLVHGYAACLTSTQIHLLLQSHKVDYITLDAMVKAGASYEPSGARPLDGERNPAPVCRSVRPIGIAVLDSMLPQPVLSPAAGVRVTLSFTDSVESRRPGPISQGSLYAVEVAATVQTDYRNGGTPLAVRELPMLDIAGLQVLGEGNRGMTSDLIRAIEWVIENRDEFGIRVANLSLSHPAFESHLQDPLCQAVRKMVEAGVVTIASVLKPDNRFRTAVGSPGLEPSIITVTTGCSPHGVSTDLEPDGASETGRGYKPDLSVDGQPRGNGLAAAEVSAAVARMLASNPWLTPTMVKSILLSTGSGGNNGNPCRLDARAAVEMAARLFKSGTPL